MVGGCEIGCVEPESTGVANNGLDLFFLGGGGIKGPQTKTVLKVESMLDWPFHKMDASQEGRKTDSHTALLILVLFGLLFPMSLMLMPPHTL